MMDWDLFHLKRPLVDRNIFQISHATFRGEYSGQNSRNLFLGHFRNSFLLPQHSLDPVTKWTSDSCNHTQESDKVENIIQELLSKRDELLKSDIDAHMQFINLASGVKLHKNHYILTITRRWILHLLCRDPAKTTKILWQRKLEMAQNYLEVLNIVNPGFSRDRGNLKTKVKFR
jgi:hypothetical protein